MFPCGPAFFQSDSSTFTPTDLVGLLGWYDASVTSSITSAANLVSQWNDLSGNARHAVQATGANKFTTGITTVNSLNALTATGSGFMTLPYVDDAHTRLKSQEMYCFAVMGNADAVNGSILLTTEAAHTGSPSTSFLLGLSPATSGSILNTINAAGRDFTGLGAGTSNGTTHIVGYKEDAGLVSTIYFDGQTTTAGTSTDILIESLFHYATVAYYLQGTICEVFFGNFPGGLSSTQATIIKNYLATKWGTSGGTSVGTNRQINPGRGAITISGWAPGVAQTSGGIVVPQSAAPGVGSLSLSGYAPTVTRSTSTYVFNATIAADTTNYNLRAAAVAAGWDEVLPLIATVTITGGVLVGSTSTSTYAFDTGATFPVGSTLSVVNNGLIYGKGGAGGKGCGNDGAASDGAAGGPGLRAQFALSVNNLGIIASGGGGGGGGAMRTSPGSKVVSAGSGGGGGRGGATSLGGAGGVATNGTLTNTDGDPGTAGNRTAAGAGGMSFGLIYGAGGTGGELGTAGDSGHTNTGAGVISAVGAGGSPGNAVTGNSYITWSGTPVATSVIGPIT